MGHDQVDVCNILKETDPVGVGSSKVSRLSIDVELQAIDLCVAGSSCDSTAGGVAVAGWKGETERGEDCGCDCEGELHID